MIDRSFTIRIKKPDLYTVLMYLWFFERFALTITRFILARLGIYESMTRTFVLWGIASIPIIIFLLYIKKIEQYKYIGFLVVISSIILIFIISFILNPELGEYFTRSNYGIDRILRPDSAIYAFLFFSLFENPVKLRNNLTVYAYLDFAYLIVIELLPSIFRGYWVDIGSRGQEIHLTYSLSFGYAMAFSTIVFLYVFIKRKKFFHFFLFLVGLGLIVTQGNRGALIIPVIFVGLMAISSILQKENSSKKALKIILIVFLVIVIGLWGQILFDAMLKLLKQKGVSSRNIEMLLSGKIYSDNGRGLIWMTAINAIRNGGVLGYGILGDRPFISPIHYVGYSHNLFLELIVSFGIIGVAIIIYIIADAIQMIFLCKDREWREIYIILFSVSFQLMLSMSFWYVWQFWAAVAVAYRYRKLKRKKLYNTKKQV